VLARPPRRQDAQLLDWTFLQRIALIGFLTSGVALIAFGYEFYADNNLQEARNAAFSAPVMAELLRSFCARSETRTVLQVGLFSNLRLFVIVMTSLSLQLLIHRLPVLAALFGTEPLSLPECAVWIGLGAIPLAALELGKILRQAHLARPHPRS